MSEVNGSAGLRRNPYVGLDYYDETLGGWFFGRDTETGQVITNLRAARLTLLHAGSGVGKSSLLRAGAAWRMRKLADENLARRGTARSVPIVFSSWKDDPAAELAETIRAAVRPYLAGRPEPPMTDGSLDTAMAAAADAARSSLLVMLDQFEEYFLYRSREPQPERFADELARCINRPDLRVNFLIAIREDAYAGLGDLFKGRIANVYGNYLSIEYLDRASAEQAIRRPVQVYNSLPGVQPMVIQDELVEAVLDQVRATDGGRQDQAGTGAGARAGARTGAGPVSHDSAAHHDYRDRIATPLLQLVMETVWEREQAEGSRELRLETLQELKGVRTIVDTHLASALESLGDRDREVAVDMFDHLVSPSGGKVAESVPDLARRTRRTEDEVRGVLERLDQQRIVRPIAAAPGLHPIQHRRYEIFHDVLAPTINRVLAAREEQRRARKLRRYVIVATALLLVAVAVGGVFAALWHNATSARHAAQAEKLASESRQLAAEADVADGTDPAVSALLALEALRIRNTSQAEYALRAALPDVDEMRVFADKATVYSAAFDPVNDNEVVSADDRGITWIWDVKTGRRLFRLSDGGFNVTGGAGPAVYNAAGTEVAVAYADHRVAVFTTAGGTLLKSASVPGATHVNSVSFVGDTEVVAIATPQGLDLWYPQGTFKCCDLLDKADVGTVASNPIDPAQLVVTGSDGTIVLTISKALRVTRSRLLSSAGVNDAVFSTSGSQVAAADTDGSVQVFSTATSRLLMTLTAGSAQAYAVSFNRAGDRLVAGYSNGLTRVWDISSRLPLATLAGPAAGVLAASFNSAGTEIVTASLDDTVRVWHSQPPELAGELTISGDGAPDPVYGVAITKNGDRIIAFAAGDEIHVLTTSGQPVAVLPTYGADYVTWNPSATLIAVALASGQIELWHLVAGTYVQVKLAHPIQPSGPDPVVILNQDGSHLVSIEPGSYVVRLRNARTGQLLRTFGSRNAMSTVSNNPGGTQIVAGDYDGQLEVWHLPSGQHEVLGGPGPSIKQITFAANGNAFSTISQAGIVSVWETRDDRLRRSIDACVSPITAAISSGARMVAVTCADGTVPVYSVATGQLLTELPPVTAGTPSGAWFSPNGQHIVESVYGPGAGGIEVWSLRLASPSAAVIERDASQLLPLTEPTG
jgi:WD40 repeat protein